MSTMQHDSRQFWVIGGQYADLSFRELQSAPDVRGPFDSYEAAKRAWATEANRTRSDAHAHYTITATPERR